MDRVPTADPIAERGTLRPRDREELIRAHRRQQQLAGGRQEGAEATRLDPGP